MGLLGVLMRGLREWATLERDASRRAHAKASLTAEELRARCDERERLLREVSPEAVERADALVAALPDAPPCGADLVRHSAVFEFEEALVSLQQPRVTLS